MRIVRALLIAGLLLAGCGGESESGGDPESEIRTTFDAYNAALADREYSTACDKLAPETVDKLRENIKKLGATDVPDDCDELLKTLYTAVDKVADQKKAVDDVANSAKIDSVKVDGDKATVNWSATVSGQKVSNTQTARRVDGEWKLVDVTN